MYSFDLIDSHKKYLVIFSGQLEGDDHYYGYEIDKILKKNSSGYDELIFLCPNYIEASIQPFLSESGRMLSNLQRVFSLNQLNFVSFNEFAELEVFDVGVAEGVSGASLEELRKGIIKYGLLNLVEKKRDQVILKAPPGTIFRKPSQKIFGEFIKASELAVGFSENQFVAFSLLSHRPDKSGKEKLRHIWIDSSSISMFIESLIYYIVKFRGDDFRSVKFHSFQSYGDDSCIGYKNSIPDVVDDVWVIISASRSNSMGRDIYKCWAGIKHEQIVTLLSYCDTEFDHHSFCAPSDGRGEFPRNPGDSIVVNISQFSECHLYEEHFGSEIPIKIVGENFTAQVEKPNKVLIRKAHSTSAIQQFIQPIYNTGSFVLNKSANDLLRTVFFDFEAFKKESSTLRDEYDRWLDDIVNWCFPVSIGHIIYDFNDPSSVMLFNDLQDRLSMFKYSAIDLNDVKQVDREKSVVVLAPVMSRGHSFVKLNSDLRLLGHKNQRIFVAPFATPPAKRDFDRFEKSLVMAPGELKYQFLNFRKVFVGHQEAKNSWERELELIERFTGSGWVNRADILGKQSAGIKDEIGVSADPNNASLNFTVDFAFWRSGYDPDSVNYACVYLTIASILQNLREKPYTEHNPETLFSHVYQHSVLDPANFSRFNDPLLQSCLWRAAYDRELDYATSPDLSRNFIDILKRLSQSLFDGEYNGALDLLLGVAIGKIKLTIESMRELVSFLKVLSDCNSMLSELVAYLDSKYLNPSKVGENTPSVI